MNRYRWIGWLTAILLAFSLLVPAVGAVGAQEGDDELLPADSSTAVEEPALDETLPDEVGTEETPDSGTAEVNDLATDAGLPDELAEPANPEIPDPAAGELPAEREGDALELIAEEATEEPVVLEEEAPDVSGSIKVYVEDQYGDPVPGVGLQVSQLAGSGQPEMVVGELATDDNGIAIFLGLDPVQTFAVNLTSLPPGYLGFSPETAFEVVPADTTEDLSPLDAVLYLGIEKVGGGEVEAGKLTILKYYCDASGPEYQRVLFEVFANDLDSIATASEEALSCEPGWAKFWVEPVKGGPGFFAETDPGSGSVALTGLAPGEYEITEVAPWESGTFVFEVYTSGVTTIAVQNFVYEGETGEGALEIQKDYCPAGSVWTEFTINEVSTAHKECEPGKAHFVIFPYFAGEGIEVETDHDGYLLLQDVPEGTHLLMEVETGATFAFTIVDGQTTSIAVHNYYVPDHSPDGDHTPPAAEPEQVPVGGIVVEQLPNTGAGSTTDQAPLAMMVGIVLVAVAVASLWVRLRLLIR
jgi:hypothetical protein